jgi:DNA-binding MarR family transcriptional regulator
MSRKPSPQLATDLLQAAVVVRRAFPQGGFEGIDATGLQVLLALQLEPGRTASDLAHELSVQHTTASRALNALLRRRLVEQTADREDARLRRYTLSKQGGVLLDSFLRQVDVS